MVKVVASWSGGKDGCFACYKAIQEGFEVSSLLTMMANEERSNFHMIPSALLETQSCIIGIPIVKWKTTPKTYEEDFKKALRQMKAEGVEGLVTGDIYEVAGHEEGWLGRICREVGLKPIKPLWMGDTKKILSDFIAAGFKATVVRVNLEKLDESWLGRQVDKQFMADLLKLGTVDSCGEMGEFHTFVTDGPLFKNKRIKILKTAKSTRGGYGLLDIKTFEVAAKGK